MELWATVRIWPHNEALPGDACSFVNGPGAPASGGLTAWQLFRIAGF
jgi:hypothetical protein